LKVGCFYPASLYSAWSVSEGLVDELRRMGHDVSPCPIVPEPSLPLRRSLYPQPDELKEYDLVLVSGPEHLQIFLNALYPNFAKARTKKVGWLHETVNRSDYGQLPYRDILALFDTVFTPAIQDTALGFIHLPFGVDTGMFTPGACGVCLGSGKDLDHNAEETVDCRACSGLRIWQKEPPKEHGAVFIGMMYEKRQEWLRQSGIEFFRSPDHLPIPCDQKKLRIVQRLGVFGVNGIDLRRSAQLYQQELSATKVLVNLPSLCEHVVTKVYEGLACGAAVVTPFMEGAGRENFKIFETGKHLLYYDNNPKGLIESLLNDDEFRGRIAMQGCKEVHEKHSLRKRLEVILAA
jgi:hypothetical protein